MNLPWGVPPRMPALSPPASRGTARGFQGALRGGRPWRRRRVSVARVCGLVAEAGRALKSAVKQLKRLGAEVQEVSPPHTEFAIATYYIVATAEASANLARFDGVRYGARVEGADPIEMYGRTRGAGFGPE